MASRCIYTIQEQLHYLDTVYMGNVYKFSSCHIENTLRHHNWLMLFREIIAFGRIIRTNIYIICGTNAEFPDLEAGGTVTTGL
jgi:hypothetical protein